MVIIGFANALYLFGAKPLPKSMMTAQLAPRNKVQWNFNPKQILFIQQIAFKNASQQKWKPNGSGLNTLTNNKILPE